ncbi:YicC family protein [Candidatus Pantoea edessiphila]|uniref:YicC family protein n=1 Tax=Candidatus Pantoea edessiphila TaxID=2044610 RepID=A0A2P5SXL1_9GAMM|nr:YicC/YloC family endoribonuclease [Candidatus Pantoea edessiphila]MBK4775875.1 YicC family protein [Pantoea sp. Edef]PPI87043.1 YicC family protein [Candidatus Pantoea edessiphila]
MTNSMTAYSSYKEKSKQGSLHWEFRSVNQRYLEIYIHLPDYLKRLESKIRKNIRQRLTRGRIECTLNFEIDQKCFPELNINQELVKQIIDAAYKIKKQVNEVIINPLEILRWPGVISDKKNDVIMDCEILNSMDNALNNLIKMREKEGVVLQYLIEEKLKKIEIEIDKIRRYIPEVLQLQHKRILEKINNADIQSENYKIEQELFLITQRIDITEELDRLDIHIKETFNILTMQGAVGRRLDFMMQELSRESNTIISKSVNSNITICAIELKVLIEQIREQIQNIE